MAAKSGIQASLAKRYRRTALTRDSPCAASSPPSTSDECTDPRPPLRECLKRERRRHPRRGWAELKRAFALRRDYTGQTRAKNDFAVGSQLGYFDTRIQTWAWWRSRSTAAAARVVGMRSWRAVSAGAAPARGPRA